MSEPETKDATGAQKVVDNDDIDSEKAAHAGSGSVDDSEIDLLMYHEHNAGRLVVDPEYATSFCLRVSTPLKVLVGKLGSSLEKVSQKS